MRTRTLAARILSQLRHDRRTLALVLFAPLLILSLLYFILNGGGASYKLVVGEAPQGFVSYIEKQDDVNIKVIAPDGSKWSADEARDSAAVIKKAVKKYSAAAGVTVSDDYIKTEMFIDGTNAADAAKVSAVTAKAVQEGYADLQKEKINDIKNSISDLKERMSAVPGAAANIDMPEISAEEVEINKTYIYGREDGTVFDTYGSALIGLVIFFLVFLIAGINFLTERTSGTLEKMLSTPIRRREIVIGYTLGYSVLATVQTVFVTLFVIYALGMNIAGNVGYVFLFNLLIAVCALTMGILVSGLANSEFQMVQFIPIVVLPQVFLCGMFTLSKGWDIVGHFVPLYYAADGLQKVIIRGAGIADIWQDMLILLGFSVLFISLNIFGLRKYRRW